jgi:hypothetical protein
MDQATITAFTQLGLSGIFAIACVQLFLRLEKRYEVFTTYLIETVSASRKQNDLLIEQNRQLSLALFSSNADTMRAYTALSKSVVPPMPNSVETKIE